jgi:glycerol-3-phosphate dehydrogenase (NAD(P)+)
VKRLAIIGGGAWGTALAVTAARADAQPVLWARDPGIVTAINERRENPIYLPGLRLDPAIEATTDLAAAAGGAEGVLLAVPAQFLRSALGAMLPNLRRGTPLLLCAKGIETESLKTMSELAAEITRETPLAVLSGPSFAAEVARGLPTAVAIASNAAALAESFAAALGTARFRPYVSSDPIGVEIGGAVKNVLAIACGIVEGMGLGDNARAALITRGLAELVRLGLAKGGNAETFRGLSGLGDLVLTCSAAQSRNHALGVALGRGARLDEAVAARRGVVEGIATAVAVRGLATHLAVEMPVCAAVDAVLHRGMAIGDMVERLLSRPFRAE